MEPVLRWGADVVLWWQQFSPTWDPFSRSLSFLGDEMFFLIFLPVLYWAIDRAVGMRLAILFMLSAYVNSLAKELAGQPRPFEYDPRVSMIVPAKGGGLPSGHTQGAVVVWGFLALQFRRRWLWVLAALLMILIPLSRVYLGVHFPHDLAGGYVLGVLFLVLYYWPGRYLERWLAAQRDAVKIALVCIAAPIMGLSLSSEDGITGIATFAGLGIGFVLERRWVEYEPSAHWWKRGAAVLLGLAVVIGLWLGLRLAFADLEPAALLRFARYALTGLWASWGAPWLFVRLGLARQRDVAPTAVAMAGSE